MKIFKIVLGLLTVASLILSINLILTFNRVRTIEPWQIFFLAFVAAIPIFMAIWIIFKRKNETGIKTKNVIWALAILIMGMAWLYIIRHDQIKTSTKLNKMERSIQSGNNP